MPLIHPQTSAPSLTMTQWSLGMHIIPWSAMSRSCQWCCNSSSKKISKLNVLPMGCIQVFYANAEETSNEKKSSTQLLSKLIKPSFYNANTNELQKLRNKITQKELAALCQKATPSKIPSELLNFSKLSSSKLTPIPALTLIAKSVSHVSLHPMPLQCPWAHL